jgi:hypothetical protein
MDEPSAMCDAALDKYKVVCVGGPKHGHRLGAYEIQMVKSSRRVVFAIPVPVDIWLDKPNALDRVPGGSDHAEYELNFVQMAHGRLPVPFMAYYRDRYDDAVSKFMDILLFPIER